MGRSGRGRGRPASNNDTGHASPSFSKAMSTSTFPPLTDKDDEPVECSECSYHGTYRQFRIHNMGFHYNIATTTDDTTVKDHKFYTKKLQEMSKLTRTTTFICPRMRCDSRYKSALGLSYHLETCGKTKQEVTACMVQCDICLQKFTLPNLNWHKKSQHPLQKNADDSVEISSEVTSTISTNSSNLKRKSAMKAREHIEEMSDGLKEQMRGSRSLVLDQEPEDYNDNEFMPDDIKREDWIYEPSTDVLLEDDDQAGTKLITSASSSSRPDIAAQALKYLQNTADEPNVWDTPERNLIDPFTSEVIPAHNPLQDVQCEGISRLYLPGMEQSVEFKTKAPMAIESDKENHAFTNYHSLAWFESEIVDSVDSNFIAYTGGPVTSMAWHPSGNYLAVSTMKHYMETPDLVNIGRRRTSIQIYSHISCIEPAISASSFESSVAFSLTLIVGFDYGYVNHLQWGNFWPLSCDPYFEENSESITERETRIGYICCAFEDSTCRIFLLKRSDFELEPNFIHRKDCRVRVYRKIPEIVLCIPESAKQSTGQCTRFDWHEGNRYVVAGYASGLLAVFDLETKSKFLRTGGKDGETPVMIFYPFWVFRGHKWPVTGIHVDPNSARYFYTGSMDRYLKAWDVDLRQEIETKKIGMVIDTCWIRGFIHIATSTDLAVSNLSSQYNFVRFYQVGSSQGRPNCLEYYNLTSIAFHEGMTVQGSENGKVTVTYFDSFWRECDFDRNKRKKNAVHISVIELDEETVKPLSGDWLNDRTTTRKIEKEPKVILSFVKERLQGQTQMQPEPTPQYDENLIRYYYLLRINKVAWCPSGKYLAVGYRNGLVTIMPATFDILYNAYHF